ncbi:hypothetical protein LUZ60_015287 [Juncus effusus]|nr:hypothetical protein LUZ60_015287 [Juncus effusus]
MGRYSPRGGGYDSPPRRGYGGGRGRSPPRRGGHGGGGRQTTSLLVRNIPLSTRAEDLRVQFERFGPVRDVYLPKDYYTGEPRGFAFVEFIEPRDASEAQRHMNGQIICGREIAVVLAAQNRKHPDEMRSRGAAPSGGGRGNSRGYGGGGRRSSYRGRSRSPSYSRSPSPRYRDRSRSRSYSPAPRRREEYSLSPRFSRSPRPRLDNNNNNNNNKRSSPMRGSRSRSADLSPGLSR